MYLVNLFEVYTNTNKEYCFSTLSEANDFLYKLGLVCESLDDGVHYWADDYSYATIKPGE